MTRDPWRDARDLGLGPWPWTLGGPAPAWLQWPVVPTCAGPRDHGQCSGQCCIQGSILGLVSYFLRCPPRCCAAAVLLASHRQPPDWFLVSRSRPAHHHWAAAAAGRAGRTRSGDRGALAPTPCVRVCCVVCSVRCIVCSVRCAVCCGVRCAVLVRVARARADPGSGGGVGGGWCCDVTL